MTVLRRPDVGDHADDPDLPRRPLGLGDVLSPAEFAVAAQHFLQDPEPVAEVFREVLEGAFACGPAGDVPQDPHLGPCVRGAFAKPSERRGDGFRRARGRRGNRSNPGGRGPSDAGRMSDVRQGHEERRFGARPEESFEFRDGVLLHEEEVDGFGLEERSPLTHERQKLLAHPGAKASRSTNNLRRLGTTPQEN